MKYSRDAIEAISRIETMGLREARLQRLAAWPGLTLEQRGFFLIVLCRIEGDRDTRLGPICEAAGIDCFSASILLKGRKSPFELVGRDPLLQDRLICPQPAFWYAE